MKKMLVIGCYGCGNRGDDAILQGICGLFKEYKISALNGRSQDISSILPVKSVPCRLNEGFSLPVLFSMIGDFPIILKNLISSDVIMYGGGSLIHDLTPYNLIFHFLWSRIARMLNKDVFYFSMGIGPVKTQKGKAMCKHELSRCSGVYVRDKRGLNICRELSIRNVKLTADAAFAVKEYSSFGDEVLKHLNVQRGNYVVVTACQWFHSENYWKRKEMDFSENIKNLTEVICSVYETLKIPIVFVPTEKEDYSLGLALRNIIKFQYFYLCPAEWDVKKITAVLENSYLVLGMRMHSIILAARRLVPFVALIYDEKVKELLGMLELEEYGLSIDEMNENSVVEIIKKVVNQYEKIQEQLKYVTEKLYQNLCSSAEEIKNVRK